MVASRTLGHHTELVKDDNSLAVGATYIGLEVVDTARTGLALISWKWSFLKFKTYCQRMGAVGAHKIAK